MTDVPQASIWRRDVISWSLYDFANTIYSIIVVSLYLKRYIVEDLGRADYYYDVPFSASMLLAAIVLPALGAISDHSAKKKIFLFLSTLACCSAVGLMSLVPATAFWAIIVLFIIANFSYEAGQPFYNALLYSVAEGRQARLVSGFGVAWGYVGSLTAMVLVPPFVTGTLAFPFLSMDIPFLQGGGKTAAFLPAAILFFLFALPVVFAVRERRVSRPARIGLARAYRDVWVAIRQTKRYPGVLRFLIADFFVEDAAATVILNIGIYCSLVLGMSETQIVVFVAVSTVSTIVGSFAVGYLSKAWSLRKLLYLIMIGWIISLFLFALVDSRVVVWILGSMIGILLGGLWTTTRPFLAELVPRDELGKFFGLFSLSGRAAAVIGPLVWTSAVLLFRPGRPIGDTLAAWLGLDSPALAGLPYKMAVLALALMVLVGLIIFRKVPRRQGHAHG